MRSLQIDKNADGSFDVVVRREVSDTAEKFALQIFASVLTLVTAVSSFYFGTRASESAIAAVSSVFCVTSGTVSVSGITPSSGASGSKVLVTNLSGSGFASGATVRLRLDGQSDTVAADADAVTPTRIVCVLDLAGAAVGKWDVIVRNPSGAEDTKKKAFEVTGPAASNEAARQGDDDKEPLAGDRARRVVAPAANDTEHDAQQEVARTAELAERADSEADKANQKAKKSDGQGAG